MQALLQTTGLLVLSNIFMTFAWYGHLGELRHKPLIVAILFSRGSPFYCCRFQRPDRQEEATAWPSSRFCRR